MSHQRELESLMQQIRRNRTGSAFGWLVCCMVIAFGTGAFRVIGLAFALYFAGLMAAHTFLLRKAEGLHEEISG